MPRLLRVTDGARWDFADDLVGWAAINDLPAGPLGDLRPSASNKLSVWVIEDNDSNLIRVVAALAASRANIDPFEARLVDAALVQRLGLETRKSNGQTKDKIANKTWHQDIVGLTYAKVGDLVWLLATHGMPVEHDETEVTALIAESVRVGHIKLDDLAPNPVSERAVGRAVAEALRNPPPAG